MTHVPREKWGKDHWSTFAYLETRCVDYKGELDRQHLRIDPDLHPGLAHRGSMGKKYPTRLKDGEEVQNHDDMSCLDDIEQQGLIIAIGTGMHLYSITDKGSEIARQLRKHKSNGGSFATFEPDWSVK